jgi:hypothetical protein
MTNFELLERLGEVDPPDLVVTARVAAALEGAASEATAANSRGRRTRLRSRRFLVSAISMIIIVVAAVTLVSNGGGLSSPITTAWQTGHSLAGSGSSGAHASHGTWTLMDDVLSGTWQQDLSGPPPGDLTCSDASTCFALSGHYASDTATSPTSESLYVSSDFNSTWTVFPMPSGFLSTSSLVCSGAVNCFVAGTYNAQPVLVSTSDGGHSFVISPLPEGVGEIFSLSCPTSQFCAALVSASTGANSIPADATMLTTSDAGANFSDTPIIAGDSMDQLVCVSSQDCTAIGASDVVGGDAAMTGVSALTTDGGRTWSAGAFPEGFGVDQNSEISCGDSTHCSSLGIIQMPIANSPMCSQITPAPPAPTRSSPPPQSLLVRRIAQLEYRYAETEIQNGPKDSGTCLGGSNYEFVSDIATTTNGGISWTPQLLPVDVPDPQLTDITCPSDSECWAAGSDAIPQHVSTHADRGLDGGSAVILGTTDDGTTWSRFVFQVLPDSVNFEGQSFLSASDITCPDVNSCAANGAGAAGAPSAPIYTLSVPNTAT